ncbi:MAG: pirin family protein [Salinibacter sp.]|uniref:pirin family protein n=1 Tax=Salinibacter sp. TaxID=2065818 RepID=UPI0035D4594E
MTDSSPQTTESAPRIRRSDERGVQDLGWSVNRMTFSFADYYDPDWMRFGPLRVLIESRIDPNEGFSEHPHRHAEIVSYVTEGTLRHRDGNGHEADIGPGEMQLISAGRRGMVHQETNPRTEPEAHYQMWFIPDRDDTSFAYHERKPSVEARRGQFHTYVSPDGRGDTMPVHTDAFVYAGLFAPDDRPSHALPPGRGAWVQVVDGTVSVGGVTLRTGDGAGFTDPTELYFAFVDESEVLLIDVRMDVPRIWG